MWRLSKLYTTTTNQLKYQEILGTEVTSEQRDLFHVQTQTLGVKYLNIGAQEYLQLIYSDIFTCQKCLISGSFDILILYSRFYSGFLVLEFHHFRPEQLQTLQ